MALALPHANAVAGAGNRAAKAVRNGLRPVVTEIRRRFKKGSADRRAFRAA